MDIEQAKAIPIAEILARLGFQPVKASGRKLLYSAPTRKERTPSFWVYLDTNSFFDYGDGIGGDAISFARAWLRSTREADTVSDALRWLKNMGSGTYDFKPIPELVAEENDASLVMKKAGPIRHVGLLHYLQKRGIPLALADHHLKEIHVRNTRTGKSFFALGVDNEEGGYELRNPFFKGSLGPKAITFIRGREPQPDAIHLFEGFFDYLSAIAQFKGKGFKGDTIILNSIVCLKQTIPYILDYGYRIAYTWFDNNPAGEKATASFHEFCQTQDNLTHRQMNRIYAPYDDVNVWHVHKLNIAH